MMPEENGDEVVNIQYASRNRPRDRRHSSRGTSLCTTSVYRLFLRLGPVAIALSGCILLVVGFTQASESPKLQSQLASSGICIFFVGLLLFVFINCCNCCAICHIACWKSEEMVAIEDDSAVTVSSKERGRDRAPLALCANRSEDTTTTSESHDDTGVARKT